MQQRVGRRGNRGDLGKRRSRTLLQLSLLIISIYILAGLATYLLYSGSQSRLVEKSREKLIQMHAEAVYGNASYAVDFLLDLGEDRLSGLTVSQLTAADAQGAAAEARQYLQRMLATMIDAGFSGLRGAVMFIPATATGDSDLLLATAGFPPSGQPPVSILQAYEAGKPWLWTGPEYAETPEGQQLVVVKEVDLNGAGLAAYFVAVRPMEEEIASIESFCEERKERSRRNLALFDLAGIASMSLLTYVFLSLLIRRRITRPIEELQHAAAEVMSGDLNVEVPVRDKEEFAGLKRAFNTMVANLRAIISLPSSDQGAFPGANLTGEGSPGSEPEKNIRSGRGKAVEARSLTQYYMALFVTAIFLIFAGAQFLVFNHWQNGLIDSGIGETVQGISEYFANDSAFIRSSLDELVVEKLQREGTEELSFEEQFALLQQRKMSSYQRFYNQFCRHLVSMGTLGLEAVMVVLSGPGIPGGATVVVSDDESRVYNWEIPAWLLEAVEEDAGSLYFENGIPELGLEGEQFVGIETFSLLNLRQAYIGVKSLHREVGEMREFYGQERKEVFMKYVPMVMGSLAAFFILILLGLGFLVRRKITHPVEELSTAAEKVMQGNLDVEIKVREGEEIAVLQKAFKELVESFRKIISRSLEGE